MPCRYFNFIIVCALLLSARAFAKEFDFESIQELITSQNITSIDQLIPALPEDLRSNYTYVKDSVSLQGASTLYPRALLFSPNGKLILTFNGDKSQAGYNDLEVLQFRSETRQFELREITFGENKVYHSEANPKLCMACHSGIAGLGARPNWSRYAQWPGLFGSMDDKVPLNEFNQISLLAKIPRYSALSHPENLPTFPYRNTDELNLSARPNTRLGMVLTRLEAQRLAQIIESPAYAPFKDAILFTGSNCEASPGDQKIIDDIDSISKNSDYKLIPTNSMFNLAKVLRAAGIPGSDWSLFYRSGDISSDVNKDLVNTPYFYEDGVSSLQQFVVTQLADDIANTDPSFKAQYDVKTNALAQYTNNYYGDLFPKNFVVVVNDLGIVHTNKTYVPASGERGTDQNCKLFSARLKRSWNFDHSQLKELPANLLNHDPNNRYIMANMLDRKCAACHDGINAPYFGFDDPKVLKQFLRSKGYAHGTLMNEIAFRLSTGDQNFSMPKLAAPTQDIDLMRRELLDYVKNLDSKH